MLHLQVLQVLSPCSSCIHHDALTQICFHAHVTQTLQLLYHMDLLACFIHSCLLTREAVLQYYINININIMHDAEAQLGYCMQCPEHNQL